MKRIVSLLLIIALCISFTSCIERSIDGCKFVSSSNGYAALLEGGYEEIIIPEKINGKTVTEVSSKEVSDTASTSLKLFFGAGIIGDILSLMGKSTISFSDILSTALANVTTDMTVKRVFIPKSVEVIHNYAFDDFGALEYIEVDKDNPYYKSVDGVLYTKDGKTLVRYPVGKKDASFTVPEGVTNISNHAFLININYQINLDDNDSLVTNAANHSLEKVILPQTLTYIGSRAFQGSSIKTIEIPNNVQTISNSAFSYCTELRTVKLGENVSCIDTSAFSGCSSLVGIEFPNSLARIESFAFTNCTSLKNVTLPKGVNSIGEFAFSNCSSLSCVEFLGNVNLLSENAFIFCSSLNKVIMPSGIFSVSEAALKDMGFVKTKENGSTYYGTAENPYLILLDANNSNTTFVLNCNTKVIAESAFYDYPSFESIEINGNSQYFSVVDGILYSKDGGTLIKYPAGRQNERFIIPSNVTKIGNFAFAVEDNSTSKLKIVSLGNQVTAIGCGAFKNTALTNITIPKELEAIPDYAFSGCKKLVTVIFSGKSLKSIGEYAFTECTSLYGISIPEGVKTIGAGAFYKCNSLENVSVPNTIESLGKDAFSETSLYYYLYDNGLYLGNTKNPYHVLVTTNGASTLTTHNNTVVIASGAIDKGVKHLVITDNVFFINDEACTPNSDITTITFVGSRAAWNALRVDSDAIYVDTRVKVECLDGNLYYEHTFQSVPLYLFDASFLGNLQN